MNRAWIPAGALAGVSVAGLLALGPLTDSMGTQVAFPTTVQTPRSAPADFLPVSVRVSRGPVGHTTTTSLRGGEAKTTATSNSDTGFVAYNKKPAGSSRTTTTTTVRKTTPAAKPKVVVKKTVRRQGAIGAPGETNGSAGLASGSSSTQTGQGEQQSTPSIGN
jgi:hypothetical protein